MSSCTIPLYTDHSLARRGLLSRQPSGSARPLPASVRASVRRIFGADLTPAQVAARVLADVRLRGDDALLEYTRLIDGADLDQIEVTDAEMETAWDLTPLKLRDALERAADRVRSFHQCQPRQSWMDWHADGGALGQIVRPLNRVGIYAPGGSAPYPSSLIMAAVPARVAGVSQVLVATPPLRNGSVNPSILAAARIAGVHHVYKIGGAQAIGALAYGTESVPQVDKVVGPGNVFVVAAKQLVFGAVGVDQLPGPTETVIIADDGANPAWVAADLLAQAEHDPLASAILLTPSVALAHSVQSQVECQIASLSRHEIIAESLLHHGGIVLVQDLDQAVQLANEYAPEHLCLLIREPWSLVGRISNAGGIFVGDFSSEALGDYLVGPSHIMPTGGTARFSSPLNVWDFLRITSIFAPSASESRSLSDSGVTLAEAEGLTAHSGALRRRMACEDDAHGY
jgi:histidinol dehydrogenase